MSTTHGPLRVEAYVLGDYATNCYLVEAVTGNAPPAIIDCGAHPRELLDAAAALSEPPSAIVLTHAHLDHIAGLFEARDRFPDTPIWIHEAEEHWLTDSRANLSFLTGADVTAPPADRLLRHGESMELAGVAFEIRHTPGHSPGSIALYAEPAGLVFAGDALFNGSIGRTDFPGGDFATLERSIRDHLYSLPGDTTVYAGHGPHTTIGHERRSNPFVSGA